MRRCSILSRRTVMSDESGIVVLDIKASVEPLTVDVDKWH
jgi:hypothetical protein